ncbi:chemotaxis signal transduction protein [Rivularia sp. PCC 7116]|uniref:chemotaxis protein CheW n=1 Tax=Rivularia sp. PCC 7116 TaxID=373994 RepID=UPI00029F2111|nr:chemotaxis protein CheW [Rivularia sp. PCC 7116]AFY57043.1 chemotaxis signal transduction protein [Rivularia sp. PCC 7116]
MDTTEEKFLSFNLGVKDTAIISLQNVTEILPVSLNEVCCVPQMPNCVFGIYNWRGEMLWLIDLEEMLGYLPYSYGSSFVSKMMAIILEKEGKSLGLLVRQIMDIEEFNSKQMKPPSPELVSQEVVPFLEGYFINSSEEMIVSLDASAILQSPLWSIHN